MKKDMVIAIDGPSGGGKSTVAKKVAQSLSLLYLDTGAMFRGIAYCCSKLNIDFSKDSLSKEDESTLSSFLNSINFEYAPEDNILIRIDGVDLTQKIREHEVSALTSQFSKFPLIRTYLADFQRQTAKRSPAILEGRDIGTVIFPNALVKIFLTASSEVRAKRRLDQLIEKDSSNNSYCLESIKKDIEQRDAQDSQRDVAPLKKADDAIALDTSDLSIDDVCKKIVETYRIAIKEIKR